MVSTGFRKGKEIREGTQDDKVNDEVGGRRRCGRKTRTESRIKITITIKKAPQIHQNDKVGDKVGDKVLLSAR